MKKVLILCMAVFLSVSIFAQTPVTTTEITKRNSWLKIGALAGVPVGDLSDASNFTLGIDLKGQLMETNHLGIGLTTGYNHFFAKGNGSSFGTIPIGAFVRVYPESKGFFAGLDGGYSVLTGIDGAKGGVYLRPQIGYHNYDWNVFGYYNNVFRSNQNGGSFAHVGIGATYNIRFN